MKNISEYCNLTALYQISHPVEVHLHETVSKEDGHFGPGFLIAMKFHTMIEAWMNSPKITSKNF